MHYLLYREDIWHAHNVLWHVGIFVLSQQQPEVVEYNCAISLLLGIICHICLDAWCFIMQCNNNLCLCPKAEKLSFELHSLKQRIGENRSNYFCSPYFCAGSSFLWGKFCEAQSFGILRKRVMNINTAFINVYLLERKIFIFLDWYSRANQSLCLMDKCVHLKRAVSFCSSPNWKYTVHFGVGTGQV